MPKYLRLLLVIFVMASVLFAGADEAEAKKKRKKDCENFEAYGYHQTGSGRCAQLGTFYCQGFCVVNPTFPGCPGAYGGGAPSCGISNSCKNGDVWRTETSCSDHPYQACLYGCANGACNPAPVVTSCIPNQPCTSAPNACGMTNGVKSCATNTCIAPSNSLCPNTSCLGPDGATIVSGESRVYYTSATSCTDAQTRTCTAGVLSGDAAYTSSACIDNSGNLPEIKVFRMAPSTVNKNDKCTMVWEVNLAQVCTITGPGITSLNAKLPSGTAKTASTTQSNLYKLKCTNTKGTVEKTAICRLNPEVIED